MPRTLASGRSSALALLLFVSVSAGMWVIGNGAPDAHDGSQSYAGYLAGYNAATFPGVNPLLADMVANPDATAHPAYAAREAGLFARAISQALIRIGIADLGVHNAVAILVTASALLLAIQVLTRIGGTALAATTTLLFALDYVGVLNWVSNLAVALDLLLFWGNLFLLLRYIDRPTRLRLALSTLGIFLVVVHDLTFGAFVLLVEICALWQLQQSVRTRLTFTLATGLAALVALAGWAAVITIELGPTALPTPSAGDLGSIVSAYRAMFALGHGAVALLIYPLLILEIVWWLRPGLRSLDVGVMVVALAIAATLWIDRSSSVIDDWEPLPGRAIVRTGLAVVLIALLVTLAMRLARARRFPHLARDASTPPVTLTTRTFVVALGLAALVLTLSPIGDFVPRFVGAYRPSLVFVEDVILATVLLSLARRIRFNRGWSMEAVAALATIVVLGGYWLAYQGRLALRYPPTESSLAASLRGNASLAGGRFLAPPDLYPVVWYATHGVAQSLGASAAPLRAQYLVCKAPCDQQTTAPHGLDLQNVLMTSGYNIYALATCPPSDLEFACARTSSAQIPPALAPTSSDASPRVALTLSQTKVGEVAQVSYTYSQIAGTPEVDSVVRLYVMQNDANWCLIQEVAGQKDISLPGFASGRFRASVIPRSNVAEGTEYFSDPVDLHPQLVVTLPDTRSGGVQTILAESLEGAEQIALAAGTWNTSAGTLGSDAVTSFNKYPPADTLCRE